MPEDIEKLEIMAESFISPETFAFHIGIDLIVNGVKIFEDIASAILSFSQLNYYKFGQDCGGAIAAVFIGQQHAEMVAVKSGR